MLPASMTPEVARWILETRTFTGNRNGSSYVTNFKLQDYDALLALAKGETIDQQVRREMRRDAD